MTGTGRIARCRIMLRRQSILRRGAGCCGRGSQHGLRLILHRWSQDHGSGSVRDFVMTWDQWPEVMTEQGVLPSCR
jgi:hypothetical protein